MKHYLAIFLFVLLALPVMAQKAANDSVEVSGRIVDSFTREVVDGVWMEFFLPDSVTLVDTLTYKGKRMEKVGVWGEWEMDQFARKLPCVGKYLIKCTKKGYKPLWQPLDIPRKKYNKRVKEWPIGDLLLSKSYYMEESLDEVTVTATKIKMFQHGDTVVFNADAFQLSEGSMLDELIRQLPGVELKDGGQIYINGNKVDELLVNGKNFFKGDAKIALENLPAYTVQNVKAYQKEARDAFLDKHHEKNKKHDPWVLDVGLKREYNKGWITNVEAGYGTDNRYLGRMFVTRYTDHSRITAYGNANNISDMSTPGSDSGWLSQYSPSGQRDAVNGGVEFHVDGKKTGTEFDTSVRGSRAADHIETENSSTTFLTGGDVFGRSRSINHDTSGSLDWDANLYGRKKNYWTWLTMSVGYSRSRSNNQNQSATLWADPMDAYRGATLDTLFSSVGSTRLSDILTNKSHTLSKGDNTRTSANIYWSQSTISPLNGERVSWDLRANYDNEVSNSYRHYDLRQSGNVDFRNEYTRRPARNYGMELGFSHGLFEAKGINVALQYGYKFEHSTGNRALYRLDQLEGWGADGVHLLGALPSATDSLALSVDAQNSYHSIKRDQTHTLGLVAMNGGDWGFYYISIPYYRKHNEIEDSRGVPNPRLTRCFDLWAPSVNFKWQKIEGNFSFRQVAPSMTHLINVTDNSNPLSVTMGNSKLGKTYQNGGSLRFVQHSTEKQSVYSVGVSYAQGTQIGNAMTYDRETGVYTYQPRNVKGNWNAGFNLDMTQPLGKKKHFTLTDRLNANYLHSVDYAMESDEALLSLSKVDNYTLENVFRLNYKVGDYSVSANVSTDYARQSSAREGFRTANTLDFRYGLSTVLKFKFGMEFSSDITMHSRRGYEDKSMNDNNLVWNASLSKSLLKKKSLCLKIVGHDILQQLSNVTRSVNAQGRTESWTNSQPAYGLLSISYRFTKTPKKKETAE